jgi:hypothetical protein
MSALMDFTTPYVGGPSFYTGVGVTSLVPDVFPVAIGGHAYMIDMKSQQFGRAFESRLRDSSDDSNIPGEAALNSQGLWRRSQLSWHKGSGQLYADTAEGVDTRFWTSKNVDPWTKGRLSLLKGTTQALTTTATNLPMVVVGSYLYVGDGDTLKYTTDPYASTPTWTSVTTGAPASSAVEALATDGTNVYISYNNNSIYSCVAGASSVARVYPSSGTTTYTYNVIEYVKGRIMSAHDNHIHTATTGTHAPFYEHPNTAFKFVGFAAGQNAIYAAGFAGKTSIIYKITIKADGTLDVPVVAGELPVGEVVSSITGYLGFVLIGTDKGIRLATSDDSADLLIGPALETSGSVKCAAGFERFVWYGWTNFDGTSTGLGRIDLSELNGLNEPAYASDLMADVQGAVNSVATWDGKRVFAVAGHGVYVENVLALAQEGYIETGSWRWGIPDRKFAAFVDYRFLPLNGTIKFSSNYDELEWKELSVVSATGSVEATQDANDSSFGEAKFKLEFTRSASSSSNGPVLTRWQVRAFPSPQRSELFSVPLLLHRKISQSGREYFVDVLSELSFLRDLIRNARIITYQEGRETFKVVVENVQWVPVDYSTKVYEFDGTAVVTMRSLAA